MRGELAITCSIGVLETSVLATSACRLSRTFTTAALSPESSAPAFHATSMSKAALCIEDARKR